MGLCNAICVRTFFVNVCDNIFVLCRDRLFQNVFNWLLLKLSHLVNPVFYITECLCSLDINDGTALYISQPMTTSPVSNWSSWCAVNEVRQRWRFDRRAVGLVPPSWVRCNCELLLVSPDLSDMCVMSSSIVQRTENNQFNKLRHNLLVAFILLQKSALIRPSLNNLTKLNIVNEHPSYTLNPKTLRQLKTYLKIDLVS